MTNTKPFVQAESDAKPIRKASTSSKKTKPQTKGQ